MEERRYDGTTVRSEFDVSELADRLEAALADEHNASVTIHKEAPASWRSGAERTDPRGARNKRKAKRKAARAARRRNRKR